MVSRKLDVALGLEVNQYKLFVQFLSSLNSLISVVVIFTCINNRLFLRNNRLFFCCFFVLSFVLGKLNS